MSPSMTVADCPECRGVNTVIFGTCGVCFAEFFEDDDDLQPWRDQLPSLVGPPRLATGEDPRHG
jgi:N-acyl-D-aspartate/D-glutamate deacylase